MIAEDEFVRRVEADTEMLYRVAHTLLGCDADCADAVQEALTRAWMRRERVREPYFRTWLTRILINECKAQRRRSARTLPREDFPDAAAPEPFDPALRDALERIDERYRLPLLLHYLEGFSLREIAAMLHAPLGTVKARLHRARRALLDEWTEDAR